MRPDQMPAKIGKLSPPFTSLLHRKITASAGHSEECSTTAQQSAHIPLNVSAPQIRKSLGHRMLQLRPHKKIPNVSAHMRQKATMTTMPLHLAAEPPLVQLDLTSQAFKHDPFPTLAKLRAAGPLVRLRLPLFGKVRVATTYDAVNDLLRDHQRFVVNPVAA